MGFNIMQSAKDIKSKRVSVVKADGNTRTITGTFAVSANAITGLPTGNKIEVNDRIEFTYDSVATVIENGLVGVGDVSLLEAGTGFLRVDKTLSNFATLGAAQSAFTQGMLLSFQSGILTGATCIVKTSAGLGNVTVIDGAFAGDVGYWLIVFDTVTMTGMPALAAWNDYTTVSPSISIYQGIDETVNLTDLIVSSIASPTSVVIEQTVPDIASFDDVIVSKHNRMVGASILDQIEAQSLKIGGEAVIPQVVSVPFSPTLDFLKVLWKGRDNLDNVISSENPHITSGVITDPFNVGTDMEIIQMIPHPVDKTIIVLLYQNLIDTFFYIKCFKYTQEDGFDDSYTPYLIAGADDIDIRIEFSTFIRSFNGEVATDAPHDPILIVVGGKSTPGTAIYAGVVEIDTGTLAISDANCFTWGDTGQTTAGNQFTNIHKVQDLRQIKSSSANQYRKLAVAFNTNLILLQYDTTNDLFNVEWDCDDSTFSNENYDYFGNNDNDVVVVTDNTITKINSTPATSYTISENNFARMKKLYTGVLNSIVTLYKVSTYEGVGGESFQYDGNVDDVSNNPRTNVVYDVLPANFQNSSGKAQNRVFEIGKDKLLFFQSYGYYVLVEKLSGKLLYIGRIGSDTFLKSDRKIVCVNDDTILYHLGGDWKSHKFCTDGPYLAYKKEGTNAIIASQGDKITTPYALQKGATYYWGYYDNQIQLIPQITPVPGLAAMKLGVAADSNTFIVDFDPKRGSQSAINFPVSITRDQSVINNGLGEGRVLFESGGKVQQHANFILDPATAHLGVNATANPDFWIQTYGNIASGIAYDPTLNAGTHNDVVNGGANHLQFGLTGNIIITGIANPFVTTSGTAIYIIRNGSSQYKITFKHQNVGSLAINRFNLPNNGADYIIKPNGTALAFVNEQNGWFFITPPDELIPLAVSASAALDLQIHDKFNVTVNASPVVLTLSNPVAGKTYVFSMNQGATPEAITFAGTTIKWRENTPYVANAGANTEDSVTLYYNGTTLIGNFGVDYA